MSRTAEDIVGKVFGKFTVLKIVPGFDRPKVLCVCLCGVEKEMFIRRLKIGRGEFCKICNTSNAHKHGGATGPNKTSEYNTWRSAKSRCFNPNDPMYPNYGARGITMYEEWANDFCKFIEHIGHRPKNEKPRQYSLDRIDNNKGYEPGNVRWTDSFVQARNKKNNRNFQICCQTKCLREWAGIFGVEYKLAHARIQRGMPIGKALALVKYDTNGEIK